MNRKTLKIPDITYSDEILAVFLRRVGQHIQDARIKSGMSQADVGRVVGLQPGTISTYETGTVDMPLGRLFQIAKVVGASPSKLVETQDEYERREYERLKQKFE